MRLGPLLAAALLLLASCASRRAAPETAREVPHSVAVEGDAAKDPEAAMRRPDVRTVSGHVAALGWPEPRFTLDTGSGPPLAIGIDRNTLVFLEARLGTVRDLAVGQPVRAGLSGPNLAAWVEIHRPGETEEPKRRPSPAAEPTGTGGAGEPAAGGGSRPPAESPVPPTSPTPGSPAGPGAVPGGAAGPGR